MNWQAISFDWNQVRAFLATAEEGSFSAAARVLGQTQPTLGRQVTGLEETLGVTLFERVGRGLELTPSGRELLGHVKAMGDAAARVSLAASGQSQSAEGLVRITASEVFAMYLLPPVLKHLREIAPRLEVEIIAANDIQDILRREADIAIRHVRPEQPELVARLLQEPSAQFYASTSYLDKAGRPTSVEELSSHQFIGFGDIDQTIGFLAMKGIKLTRENFRVNSKSGLISWELARQGFGITVMGDEVAEATPGMERLSLKVDPIVFPMWLVTHRELHTSKRIRLVFDTLVDFLSK